MELPFKKLGQQWLRTTLETMCKLSFGKDRWKDNQHYLEIYVSVIQLNPLGSREPTWHIVGGMFSPSVEEKVEWEKCLNVKYAKVSGKPRQMRLVQIIEDRIIPLLHSFETLDGIKTVLFSGQLRGMGIRTELQHLTGYRA
jgi:hypothetical protein